MVYLGGWVDEAIAGDLTGPNQMRRSMRVCKLTWCASAPKARYEKTKGLRACSKKLGMIALVSITLTAPG